MQKHENHFALQQPACVWNWAAASRSSLWNVKTAAHRSQSTGQQCRDIVFKPQSWTTCSKRKGRKSQSKTQKCLEKTNCIRKCAWYSLSAHLTSLCCLLPATALSPSAEEFIAVVSTLLQHLKSTYLNGFLEVQLILYPIYRKEYARIVNRFSLQPSVERWRW